MLLQVGSQCTILTDNSCEDAYDLLQTPMLKKILVYYTVIINNFDYWLLLVRESQWFPLPQLAGILLDTHNLDSYSSLSMPRDAEAVQLLLVGSSPNYRNNLFDQCMLL